MSLIGPCRIAFDGGLNFGDFVTSIQKTTPAAVTLPGINKDFSQTPARGHAIAITGVEEDLTPGTLWRFLHDHANEKDVPLTWSTQADGGIGWSGIASSIPDPSQGGAANVHGTFTIIIPLTAKPTLVDTDLDPTWAIAITGGPTGGTYQLYVNGAATAPLAYNATTAVALAAVNALEGVTGIAGVTVAGTAASYTLTFPTGVTVEATHAFTGGATPAITATP